MRLTSIIPFVKNEIAMLLTSSGRSAIKSCDVFGIFSAYEELSLSEELVKGLHAELMKDDARWEVQDAYLAGPGRQRYHDN